MDNKRTRKQAPIVSGKSKKQDRQSPPGTPSEKGFVLFMRNNNIALSIILLIAFITYIPILNNGFVSWDDYGYIRDNILIHSINMKQIFSQYVMGNYHPFTMLIGAIEYHFFGLEEKGYHAVSLLLHLCNAVFVFYAVFLLSKRTEIAVVASLLFSIHPMHVESVAWASEQKDLLYTFFFLASYICYLKYLGRYHKLFYFYALLLFIFSLLSKAMAASLPVVLILTDYFKGRKVTLKTFVEKLPFFVLALIFGTIAVFAQKSTASIQDISFFSSPQRISFACYGFITYLFRLLFPFHLNVIYPYPLKVDNSIPSWYYLYPFFFLVFVAGIIYTDRFSKKIVFGVGFFLITVFLVLQLLPVGNAIMADRYSYIPSIGIFYLAGEGLYLLWNKRIKTLAIAVLSVCVIFYSVKAYSRCAIWHTDLSLWNDIIIENPTIQLAFNNRGENLKGQQRYDEALSDFNTAIRLKPDYADAYLNRGDVYLSEKKYDEALSDINIALKLKSSTAGHNNRGIILLRRKEYEEALKDFDEAIKLDSDNFNAYMNKGLMLSDENKYPEALETLNKVIQLQPNKPEAYYRRAKIEYTLQKKDSACIDLQTAINLKFAPAEAAYNSLCH